MLRFFGVIFGLALIVVAALMGLMAVALYVGDNLAGAIFFGILALASVVIGARLPRGRKRRSWRLDPATDRQKVFADELGIMYPPSISKGDLSDLISAVTGK